MSVPICIQYAKTKWISWIFTSIPAYWQREREGMDNSIWELVELSVMQWGSQEDQITLICLHLMGSLFIGISV